MKIFTLLFVLLSTLSYSQPKYVERPDKFNSYLKARFIDKLNEDIELVESYLHPSNKGTTWLVYSSKNENPLSSRPGPNLRANGNHLHFMQQVAVVQVQGNWLLVADLVRNTGTKIERHIELGWVHARELILTESSLLNEGSIPKKALIVLSLDDLKSEDVNNEKTARKFYSSPQMSKKTENGKLAKKFEIYFILKETEGAVLLSRTDRLRGSEIQKIASVPGWFRKSNLTNWDHRVCFEINYSDPLAVNAYSDSILYGFNSVTDLRAFTESSQKETAIKRAIFRQSFTPEMPSPYDFRLPILKNIDENIKEVVTIASIENKGKDKSEIPRKIIDLKTKVSNINVLFAIDGTSSMKSYYQPVMASISKIVQNNKLTNSNSTVLRFGLIIYRDYADGPVAVEIEKLTTDYNRIIRRLSEIECRSLNKDLPEAQYHGLIEGIQKINPPKEHSNVLVVIGDAANKQPDSKGYTLNQVVNKFFEYRMSVIGFQVMTANHPTYTQYSYDMQDYLKKTAEKYPIPRANIQLKKLEIKNTLRLSILDKNANDTELFMFGRFTYASHNSPMDVKVLEQNVEEAIYEYTQKVEKEIAFLESLLSDGSVLTESIEDWLLLKGLPKEAIDFLKREGQLAKKGFTAKKQYNQQINAYSPVVFISQDERLLMNDALQRLKSASSSSGTTTKSKEAFKIALLEQVKKMLGEVSDDNILDKDINEIWQLMLAVDFTGDPTIREVKLRDLDKLEDSKYRDFSRSFDKKAYAFSNASYRERSFEIAGQIFYWIPLSDIPGNE